MFLPNDVIQYTRPVRTIRILWIAPDRLLACTFELGLPHSQPVPADVMTRLLDQKNLTPNGGARMGAIAR
jgi:hypothetical protein